MKIAPILVKVINLARRKKYSQAFRILESEQNNLYAHFQYNYIYGLCCLYARDFGNALEHFRAARDIRFKDPLVLLGLAVLYLNRGDTHRAVNFYLEIQELDEKNVIAKRALKLIRRMGDRDQMPEWLDSGQLYELYPPWPRPPLKLRVFLIPLACLVFAGGVTTLILMAQGVISRPSFIFSKDAEREGLFESILNQDEKNNPVQIPGSFRYTLSRSEVIDYYEEGRSLFIRKRDEAAKVPLNHVLESNASDAIKNKARLLIAYMDVPGFDTFDRLDNVAFDSVAKEPALYRNVHIVWRGMISNVRIEMDRTSFDFLVGYDTRTRLQGVVPVVFNFAIAVNPEKPLEILGRIVPAGDRQGTPFWIDGIALSQAELGYQTGGNQ
ncbi:tetratricopeptide repeat protein [Breznakiellaceae bacterium SP9]